MPVLLIPEDELRSALESHRAVPAAFEAGVREKLQAAERRQAVAPLERLPSWLQGAAALLPVQAIVGSKAKGAAGQLVASGSAYKILGYVAFPAISLFVLLGATVLSVIKINTARRTEGVPAGDAEPQREGLLQWWRQHKWGAGAVYAATLALSLLGATWAVFVLYIVSFGLLVYVLTALSRLGLGNRPVIAQSCLVGLMLLGQLAVIPPLASTGIQFVDGSTIAAVLYGGALLLLPFAAGGSMPGPRRMSAAPRRIVVGLLAVMLVPLMTWLLRPILWPATPERIKHYVESFHAAPHDMVSWQHWEIPAQWALDQRLDPDLAGARQLLDQEIAGRQNPFVLGSAFRLGLVRPEQLSQFRDLASGRQQLLGRRGPLVSVSVSQPITSLELQDWVIRALVLGNDLSPAERDLLARRLRASLDALSSSPYEVLHTARLATELLAAIDRPIDPAQYRARVHDWLRASHSTQSGGFEPAGGFKTYLNMPVGSLEATSDAVALMDVYGVPDQLDLNWVRAYLRPQMLRIGDQKWIAAVTCDRLNRLPDAQPLTWFELVYYDRSLLAAAVLVGLCIYATLSSPVPLAGGAREEVAPGAAGTG